MSDFQLYQYGDDIQVLGKVRPCASGGCPAVMVLKDKPDLLFDRDWQLYLVAINFAMKRNNIANILGGTTALTNNKGLQNGQNWFEGKRLKSKTVPRYDKFRTFDLNTHAGVETFSVRYAIAGVFNAVLTGSFGAARTAISEFGSGNNAITLITLDGRQPPPMKPGRKRPTNVKEVNPDDYAILPSPETRHLFLDCTNIKKSGKDFKIGPWAHGAVYDWIGDGRPHTFAPFASRYQIISPLKNWRPVREGAPFPSPFRG